VKYLHFLLALPLLAAGGDEMPRCDLVPGWAQHGPFRTYVADTLYDYMNGNSEGYLIYGFRKMNGVTCKAGDVQLVIDISEMPDPESAWGLFASNRDTRIPVENIGMMGQVAPQRGIFTKGHRFVEISASPPSADHSAAIRANLQAVAAKLDGSTALPAALGWFPKEDLDAASIRIVPQSVLGLSILKRGYLAKYAYGRAFVVQQLSAQSAVETMSKLKQRFGETQPVSIGDEGFSGADRYLGKLVFFRKGPLIGGFANLTEGNDGINQARALESAMP
jgi:hypothetical protein